MRTTAGTSARLGDQISDIPPEIPDILKPEKSTRNIIQTTDDPIQSLQKVKTNREHTSSRFMSQLIALYETTATALTARKYSPIEEQVNERREE
jgi:hypothetical protein